jgi:hypothetical protein
VIVEDRGILEDGEFSQEREFVVVDAEAESRWM